MTPDFDRELEERLLRYTAIDTQSDEASPTSPSTARQFDLLRLLVDELTGIGAEDVRLTDYGTVLATIPGAAGAPTIAFLAHVDTAPQFHASGVKPRVHRAYDGGSIGFPDAQDLVLSPEQSPYLAERAGDDIVTTDGTTLLGADDKAGVAVIMEAARTSSPRTRASRTARSASCFTCDEEIGRGVLHLELPKDSAPTSPTRSTAPARGEIEDETFSADAATVTITGVNIHPSMAKGRW